MRNAFKNLRRGYPKEAKKTIAASCNMSTEPPTKKVRLYSDDDGQIDDDMYMEALEQLQIHGKHKKSGNHKELKRLMELTKVRRHQWIREERPMIFDVIEKFPCLATNKWVSGLF